MTLVHTLISDEADVMYNLLGEATPELPFLSHQLAPLLRFMQQDEDLHSQSGVFSRQVHIGKS